MPAYTEQSDHPVPCIDAIVMNDEGKILLIRRTVPPYENHWSIVGGRIEVSDINTEAAVQREVFEETGLEVAVTALVDVLADQNQEPPADPRFYIVQIIYAAEVRGGTLRATIEADQFRWVTLDQALAENLAFNHHRLLEIYRDKQARLITAKRRYYDEYFTRPYTYLVQNDYPRFSANAIILNEKKEVLLAHRAQPQYVGYWDFPGGHMYVGETVEQCLRREVCEELGVDCEVGTLFHVYSDRGRHIKTASISGLYFVTIHSQQFLKNVEMDDFRYFSFAALPKNIAYHNDIPLLDIRDRLSGFQA